MSADMKIKVSCAILLALGVTSVTSQRVDDFQCPDEFVGYYPHLISCDKYWHCRDGLAELKTCGNGLGFLDTDDTFTLEQCAELHLVECGDRTEVEPPIATDHCPRLYGTFPDPLDCGVFWKCQDGKPNKYNCPPGLAYDQVSRGCRWADQVPECSANSVTIDDDGGEFQCPTHSTPGVFTKHAHPADCRQYFLCIGGIPREYGCPLGTVFDIGTGSGEDGKCSEPELVLECSSYYGDADLGDITRSGADTGPQGEGRTRPSSPRKVHRNPSSLQREPSAFADPTPVREVSREKSRPAPPSLQQIVDSDRSQPSRSRPSRPETHSRPQTQRTKGQFRPREEALESLPPVTPSPNRLSPIRIETAPGTTQRPHIPARLQVLTDRPSPRTTFPRRPDPPTTTHTPSTPARAHTTNSRFSPSGLKGSSLFKPPQTEAPALSSQTVTGLPDPVKAAPGPNGEEYYYYYYYYDDDDEKNDINEAAPGS